MLSSDATQPTIDIPPNSAGTAMHNDRVLVLVNRDLPSPRRGGRVERLSKRPRGKVVKVLERARTQVVGTLEKSRQLWYIVPNDPRISHDIYLPKLGQAGKGKAKRGDKVVVEITEWPSRHNAPEGRLVEVLGSASKPGVDVESVIRQYELSTRFPAKVVAEARRLGTEVTKADRKGRVDCRDDLVITIDPVDARTLTTRSRWNESRVGAGDCGCTSPMFLITCRPRVHWTRRRAAAATRPISWIALSRCCRRS